MPQKNLEGLNRFHRQATKFALGIPRRTDHPDYRPYEERCMQLTSLTPEQRFKIACTMFCLSAITTPTPTYAHTYIRNHLAYRDRNLRTHHLFNIGHSNRKSILTLIMRTANTYSSIIDPSERKERNKQMILRKIFNT